MIYAKVDDVERVELQKMIKATKKMSIDGCKSLSYQARVLVCQS